MILCVRSVTPYTYVDLFKVLIWHHQSFIADFDSPAVRAGTLLVGPPRIIADFVHPAVSRRWSGMEAFRMPEINF